MLLSVMSREMPANPHGSILEADISKRKKVSAKEKPQSKVKKSAESSLKGKRKRDDSFGTHEKSAAVECQVLGLPSKRPAQQQENQGFEQSNVGDRLGGIDSFRTALGAMPETHHGNQFFERPESIHSAGRGVLNFTRGPNHRAMMQGATGASQMSNMLMNPNFDFSLLGGGNMLGSLSHQSHNNLILGNYLQGGYLNSDQLVRNRLSALQSLGHSYESLLLGTGNSAGDPMAGHMMSSRDINALLNGGGGNSNSLLLRRAAELGLGGGGLGGGAQQLSALLNSRLLGNDANNASLLSSLLGSNSMNDSTFGGGASSTASLQANALAGLGSRDTLARRPPSSSSHANPNASLVTKIPNSSRAPGYQGYNDGSERPVINSKHNNLDIKALARRPLTDQERAGIPPLPPCEESPLSHYSQRICVPLATDEDENWLSEFLCFVRSDLVEVFRASKDDVTSRINSKKVCYGQVGIRCRYCAHQAHGDRSSRSSSFPSSIDRIYQSLTMMIRDHFVRCSGLPAPLKARFLELKSRTTQGATDSKRYWIESARRLGMVDTPGQGIMITGATQAAAAAAVSPNRSPGNSGNGAGKKRSPVLIVTNDDRPLVSEYIYFLMTQVEKVELTESERVGNRKGMDRGMPGFGCKHCCLSDRKGLCRFFPARRRTLPAKIKDLSDHLRRCTMCPVEVKEMLVDFKRKKLDLDPTEESNKHFFDRVWARLHNTAYDPKYDHDRVPTKAKHNQDGEEGSNQTSDDDNNSAI